MRILFITTDPIEATSSAMMRNNGVIKGLLEKKNKVEVLSIYPNIKQKNELIENGNFIVHRIGTNKLYNKISNYNKKSKIKKKISHIFRYIYKKTFIYNNTYYSAKKADINLLERKEYDVVISSSDPKTAHVLARELKKQGLRTKKWIQYWGDPMTVDITNKVIWPKMFLRQVERNLLKHADLIVYVSPFTLEIQRKIHSHFKDKMIFVPVPYVDTKPSNRNEKKNNLKITYLGSYYSDVRNIMPLYNTVSDLSTNVNLLIAGATDLKLSDKTNIQILPNVSKDLVHKYEECTDIFVCILNNYGTQIPGKLYHYAGTDKPILVITDGQYGEEIKNYLVKFNRFIFADNNEQSIHEALKSSNIYKKYSIAEKLSPYNIASHIVESKNFEFKED